MPLTMSLLIIVVIVVQAMQWLITFVMFVSTSLLCSSSSVSPVAALHIAHCSFKLKLPTKGGREFHTFDVVLTLHSVLE